MPRAVWLSCKKFTGRVVTFEDERNHVERIMNAPPVWSKFIGQPLANLIVWLRKFGWLQIVDLDK